MRIRIAAGVLLTATALAQPPARKGADKLSQPFKAQSSSTISYSGGKEEERTLDITNVTYEVHGNPLLVLRTSTHSKWIVGDEGTDSTATVEAWPMGVDLKQKPLYAVTLSGIGARTMEGILLFDRSDGGDSSWWSVYKLSNGQHLFDTYVELLHLTVSRADGTNRYAGLEVPPDDAADARLREPHAVAVLAYASEDKVIREVLITCADKDRAAILRSYADSTRTLALVERPGGRDIRIAFEDNYPSPLRTTVVSIPIVKDDLDVAHAQLPAGMRVAVWKR
jgi:hypothetical protein